MRQLTRLGEDQSGKALLKFTLGFCLLAIAGAASSPAFETNPLIGSTIVKLRGHLPDALNKAVNAMRGAL